MSTAIEKILFAELRLLSKQVSKEEPFFREISCLGKEEAEMIAYCHIYMDFFPEDEEMKLFLEKFVIPAFKKLGMVHWNRDILTEMGLKLGAKKREHDLAKMLGREVEIASSDQETIES